MEVRCALILLVASCWGVDGAEQLERMDRCGTRCSQGLHCKTKPDYLFHPPCGNSAGVNASIFHNVSFSTVMKCEGRQRCSLHLRIKATLKFTESIKGVLICTNVPGMMESCQIITLKKTSRERMSGREVEVENDCTSVSPGQQLIVTMKTEPSFCFVTWTGVYKAPDCNSEDLRRHVPECITGRLAFNDDPKRKELSVSVSDTLEGHNYYLRLCTRDFICFGTGGHQIIKKDEPVKSAVLPYTRPLPCLCIEGWPDVMDASRVQVCPFKHRVEELWSGITYDPFEEALSWEPACPVSAVVGLCQKREDGSCDELPNASQNVSRGKITFAKVDPHPQLCMKFTVDAQSWTRCPFTDARFQVWELAATGRRDHKDVQILSRVNATFSAELCEKSEGPTVCRDFETHTVHREKQEAVHLNLTGEPCGTCLQVKRLDVKFATTVTHCLEECHEPSPPRALISSRVSWDPAWVVVPAGACLAAVIIVTLVLHILLTVHQRRRKQHKHSGEKKTDHAFDGLVPVLMPDPLTCREKANLISG